MNFSCSDYLGDGVKRDLLVVLPIFKPSSVDFTFETLRQARCLVVLYIYGLFVDLLLFILFIIFYYQLFNYMT